MSEAQKIVFEVQDMTCGHCKKRIMAALQEAYPECVVEIDLDSHHVSIDNGGSKENLAAVISAAGYTPKAL